LKKIRPYRLFAAKGICWAIFLLYCSNTYCQQGKDEWLRSLNKTILESSKNDDLKIKKIDSLRLQKAQLSPIDLFDHYLNMRYEFAAFNFDSSFFYAEKLKETAATIKDNSKLMYALLKKTQVLLSAGMFKEVFESLEQIDPFVLDNQQKAEYYSLKARSLLDLADYNGNKLFLQAYNETAEKYIDSCLLLSADSSFLFLYYNGLKHLRNNDWQSSIKYFTLLAKRTDLPLHQQAIVYSTFSDVYIRREMTDSAIILLARAAIADIKSSTKETTAILHLANLLFKKGDIENASKFIQKAASDAKIYGARQRILQLSNVLPLIEAERLATVQKEKISLRRYATIITASLLFLVVLVFIIIIQIKKLKKQQRLISDKNISLQHHLEEKEWLLKEIHHRVKNNLHTITSLLESQSAYLENEALSAIRNSQHRVFAMSIIHQKLYQPETNSTEIDMSVYIHELVDYLQESFETGQRINFILELEPVYLDITTAVPVGLILNEAITNSLKYAFPQKTEGQITISIKQIAENKVRFNVADNGIGLPNGFDVNAINSLGMKLMQGLSDDIAAQFSIKGEQGTSITIEFMSDNRPDQVQYLQKNK